MNRENLKTILRQYFMCYTFTMLATVLFTVCHIPPIKELPVAYLWQIALFSLGPVLPSLLFYNKEDMSRREYLIRTLLHTALLEVIMMIAGYLIGLYEDPLGSVLFFFVILIIDGLIRLVGYLTDVRTAGAINRRIRELRAE